MLCIILQYLKFYYNITMAEKVETTFNESSSDTEDNCVSVSDALMRSEKNRLIEMEKELQMLGELQREVNEKLNKDSPLGLNNLEEIIKADKRSIYIGNVDYGATAEELEQHFFGCGAINRVTIRCNKYDGHPKGFAYIEFAESESIETALTMDDTMFRGRQIKVMPKRTNRPGISTTHRPPRGMGSFRGLRGVGRGFHSKYQWRPVRRPRGYRRGFYEPY